MFPQPIFNLLIPEGTPNGTTFPLPTARDLDSDAFGVAFYELESHTQGWQAISMEHVA